MTLKTTKLKLDRALKQGVIKAARSLAKSLPDVIRNRVGSGLGLNGPLKQLSDSYVLFRVRVVRRLAKTTDPATSNLTATGQMLKAITGEAAGSIVRLFIKNSTRRRELSGSGGKSNNQIREYVEKERPFFELTNNERNAAIEEATELIKQEIRRVLK